MQILFGLRAALSFGLGVLITFTQAHTYGVGSAVLAAFGLLFGLSSLGYVSRVKKFQWLMPLLIIATLVGVLALVTFINQTLQEVLFLPLVALFGLSFAAFEGYLARRHRGSSPLGRDFAISAVLSLALGLVFLLAPLDEVSAVGFLGAYLAISGVFWGITAASPQPK